MNRHTTATVATFAVCAAAWGAAAQTAGAATVITDGHLDYGARLIDGALRSQVKDGTGAQVVWREPADVVVAVGARARTTVPAKPPTAGLGAPGAPVWVMGQVQQAGVPWLGWNTESLSSAQVSGPVRWSLDAVTGPGFVTLFQSGSFGSADVLFDSADGLPDTRDVALGTHAHGNWTFSARGRYALTLTMAATAADGRQLQDTRTLNVTVEETASQAPVPAPAGDVVTPPSGGGTPGTQPPGGSSGTPNPGTPGTSTAPGTLAAPNAPLNVRSLSLAGNTLTVKLRAAETMRVRVKIRRGSRTVATSKPVTIKAKTRTVKLRLSRTLAAGTYTAQITATPTDHRGPDVRRSVKLKVQR